MIEDTLQKMEARLERAQSMTPENREALKTLLAELRAEIAELGEDDAEPADSIAGFAEASTREAIREQPDADLLDVSLTGLQKSVRRFEVSHPRLTGVVNRICHALADLGI